MHIVLRPVAGDAVVTAVIDDSGLTVNGTFYPWAALPLDGAVRLEADTVIIEYGEAGGVSMGRLTQAHTVAVIPSRWADLNPPKEEERDPTVEAQALLEAAREGWVCDRWQIKTLLGQERWQSIVAFGQDPNGSWGLKTLIDDAVQIPRVSETVEVLAYILGLSDAEVDGLFQKAMGLRA